MTENQPIIVAIVATTIDGRIGLHAHHFVDWTSREDKTFLRSILDSCDVCVVGNNTYQTAKQLLVKRCCIVLTRSVTTIKPLSKKLILCNPNGVDIKSILVDYRTVAVLGGTQTYSYFLEQGLIDELYLTIEPLVFGQGLPIFECEAGGQWGFRLVSAKKLNKVGSILLHYRKISKL